MSEFEERIRKELTTVAALAKPETIRPLRTPAPRRRPRFGRWLAPVAAVVAVTVIAGLTVAAHQTTRKSAPAADLPDIYVTLTGQNLLPAPTSSPRPISTGGVVLSAVIRDASTGAVLTSVQLWPRQLEHPHGSFVSYPAFVAQIAAAADDRTFAITDEGGLYLLRVAASGHTAQLVKLSQTIMTDSSSSIALSPDGTKLAVDVDHCPGSSPCVDGIEILNLVTGTSRTWLSSSPDMLNPSWTDNGTAVMFEWDSGTQPMNGYRILSDTAPEGNLIAVSTWLPYPPAQRNWQIPQAILTPDGHDLLVETEKIVPTSSDSGTIIFRITEEDPATGRVLRVLRVFDQHYQGNPSMVQDQCDIISLSTTGVHALIECPQFGRLDGTTFTPLPSGLSSALSAQFVLAAW
jgi:hypothetical protein